MSGEPMASDLCAGQEAARPQPPRRDQPVAARWSRALAAVVVYVAVAALVLGRVPWPDNNVLARSGDGDPAQQACCLALAHWAVTSGHF
jgi:hypothetical protein